MNDISMLIPIIGALVALTNIVVEVIKKITPDDYGQVKVLGSTWTAVCDKVCDVSEKVIVKRVDGVKLVVEKEEK